MMHYENSSSLFNPDNMMETKINGTIGTIIDFYSIGSVLRLDYSPKHEDGEP
jgi:hypothetical protein